MTFTPSLADALAIVNIIGVAILALLQDRIKIAMLTLRNDIHKANTDLKDEILKVMGTEYVRAERMADLARRMENVERRIYPQGG
jgi:hypothetical protein